MEEFYQLTGRERLRVVSLGAVPGEEVQEVETCRLAMIVHGETPANTARVIELLHKPKREYDKYIEPFIAQLACHIDYTDAGGAVVHNVVEGDNGEYELGDIRVEVRPVLGRDRRKFIIRKTADWLSILPEFTGMSDEELNDLPIGVHAGITTSLAFLAGFLETETEE